MISVAKTNRKLPIRTALLVAMFGVALMGAPRARGEAGSWEYTPYRIHVWIALAPRADLTRVVRQEITTAITRRAEIEFPAAWQLLVSEPPGLLTQDILNNLEHLAVERIQQVAEKQLNDDKVVCVSVNSNAEEMRIRARELDAHSLQWGAIVERSVRNPEMLAPAVYSCLVEAFAPIVRIEIGETRTATVRLRAGGLAIEDRSPVRVAKGDVLVPIIRNNDRYGKPLLDRTAEVPWTLLQVTGADRTNRNLLDCNVHSGMRAPLRGRSSGRKERYALRAHIAFPNTEVKIQIRRLKTDQPAVPIPGLEVYSRIPVVEPPREMTAEESKAEDRKNPPEFLGYTDWRGQILIEPAKSPLRLVYIKSGGQLLARLPIQAGRQPEQIAEVPDDAPRLQAEGYIKGFNGELMDLIAQRQLLAFRIRKRVADNKLDEAQTLLDELRALKTRNDVQRELDTQLRRQVPSPYTSVQARIDKLYGDSRTMLAKYLNPELPNELQMEIRKAKGEGGTTPAPTAKTPTTSQSPPTAEPRPPV